MVALPAVLRVMVKPRVPLIRAALAGSAALVSVDVIATVSFVLIKFQLASTAFTVRLNAVPAVWAMGVPVFPAALPGATVSPGTNNCNFVNTPGFTVIDGVVLDVL